VCLIKPIPTSDSLRIKVPEGEAAADQRTMDKVLPDCLPGWIKNEESGLTASEIASLTPNSLQTPSLGGDSGFLLCDYH